MLATLTFLALLTASAAEIADRASARIDSQEIARHVQRLASDEFAGRLPGSEGEELTVAYIADHFAALGLKPMQGDSFFQQVPLFATRPASPPTMTIDGNDGQLELKFGEEYSLASPRDEPRVDLAGSEVVFVGYGIVAPEYGWDDLGGLDLRGKTVLFLWGDPGSWGGDPELFNGRAMSRHGMNFAKIETLGRRGAAAVLAIHQPERAGWPFEAVAAQGLQWSFALDDPDERARQPLATGLISRDAAARMLAAAGLDLDTLSQAANRRDFKSLATGLRADIRFEVERKRIGSRNVIGVLPGAEQPDEYVIYSAHWDHIGTREQGEDRVFNGAVDNASGTAMLMEIARVFAGLEAAPRRSVLFLATTAEEKGLLGAEYFVANAAMPLSAIQGVVNMDASFPFGSFRGMTVTGLGNSELEAYLADAAAHVDRVLQADSSPEMGAFFRSDHYPFVEQGVPALFAVGGPTEAQIESDPAILERFQWYGQNGYHKVDDEFDPASWDLRALREDAEVYFRTGFGVAVDTRRPNWYIDSEFRALRDAGH